MSRPQRPTMLVVGSRWPPETFLERLFRGLAERGMEIRIAHRRGFGSASRATPKGIRRQALPTDLFGRVGRRAHGLALASLALARQPRLGLGLARQDPTLAFDHLAMVRSRPDLLYFPWNAAAVRHLPLLDLGIPSLISCRGTQIMVAPLDPARRALTRGLPRSFARATAVHCVAGAVEKRAIELGLPPEKSTVIRPGIDLDAFSPIPEKAGLGKPPSPFRLVLTGTIGWVKGHEYAVRALRLLVDEGRSVELHVLGDGPEAERLRFAVNDMGLEEHVRLHGSVSPDRVAEHLGKAHAFLLPSLSEGISNAALEAMARGLPVVATRCGGMAEAIEHGRDGLLVPLRDPRAIAEAVGRLIDEPESTLRLGRAARLRAEKDFSLEQHVDRFFQLCLRIVRENASRSEGR